MSYFGEGKCSAATLVFWFVPVWSGIPAQVCRWGPGNGADRPPTRAVFPLPPVTELAFSWRRLRNLKSYWQIDGLLAGAHLSSEGSARASHVEPGFWMPRPPGNWQQWRTSWEAGLNRFLVSCQMWLLRWFQYELIRLFRNREQAQCMLFMAFTLLQLETKYSMSQAQI